MTKNYPKNYTTIFYNLYKNHLMIGLVCNKSLIVEKISVRFFLKYFTNFCAEDWAIFCSNDKELAFCDVITDTLCTA